MTSFFFYSFLLITSFLVMSVTPRPGKSFTAARSRHFREPLKWWNFRAFFVGGGFCLLRNGHLRAAARRCSRLPGCRTFPGLVTPVPASMDFWISFEPVSPTNHLQIGHLSLPFYLYQTFLFPHSCRI